MLKILHIHASIFLVDQCSWAEYFGDFTNKDIPVSQTMDDRWLFVCLSIVIVSGWEYYKMS